jgi:hypothetical protein
VRAIDPHKMLAGCAVALANDGPAVVLRCNCGFTFVATKEDAFAAEDNRGTLACDRCTARPFKPKPVKYRKRPPRKGTHGPVAEAPIVGTKTYEVYRLMLDKGAHCYDAALAVGVAKQTAEKAYWRYVLPQRQAARIAELEAELAARR